MLLTVLTKWIFTLGVDSCAVMTEFESRVTSQSYQRRHENGINSFPAGSRTTRRARKGGVRIRNPYRAVSAPSVSSDHIMSLCKCHYTTIIVQFESTEVSFLKLTLYCKIFERGDAMSYRSKGMLSVSGSSNEQMESPTYYVQQSPGTPSPNNPYATGSRNRVSIQVTFQNWFSWYRFNSFISFINSYLLPPLLDFLLLGLWQWHRILSFDNNELWCSLQSLH